MSRKIFRGGLGVRLWRLRKRLHQAEVRLGWLGWQCVEFGEEADHHLEEIRALESEQGELANRGAHLAGNLAGLTNELTITKAKSEALIGTMTSGVADLRRQKDEAKQRVEKEQHMLERFVRAQKDLEVERAAGEEERDRQLYIVEDELRGIIGQVLSHREALLASRRVLGELVAEVREREAVLRSAQRDQAKRLRQLMGQIRKGHRHKTTAEKTLHSLEKKKAAPYREVGRIMADSGLGPANQPEMLDEVEAWRGMVAAVEAQIEASRAVSDAADGADLVKFYFFCGSVLFVATLVLLIAWRE